MGAHAASDHGAHDAHDDFDPEPASELSPGEPRTPSWVPLLGACLFLVGGVYFFASGAEPGSQPGVAPTASASAAPAPAQARSARAPAGRDRAAPADVLPKKAPPQDPAERQKLIDQIRGRMNQAQPPRAP